jgi:hypothetical protein
MSVFYNISVIVFPNLSVHRSVASITDLVNMQFFQPSPNLYPFIKGYLVVHFEEDLNEDIFFPSGWICRSDGLNSSGGHCQTTIKYT